MAKSTHILVTGAGKKRSADVTVGNKVTSQPFQGHGKIEG
jgi:hypothetical protein